SKMSMLRLVAEDGEVYFSSTRDAAEIIDLSLKRNGNLILKITCPKDRVVSFSIGKVEIPNDILKVGNKQYKVRASQWVADNIDLNCFELKFGSNDSFYISFKFMKRKIERRGVFRQ
ncbi:hypothetical protein EBU91_03495, partial [bacterium]|nr:hypothetical protein [bacterium]